MSLAERLIDELVREGATTKRVLERVPEDKFDWTPHPKSTTLGKLSMHLARIPHIIAAAADELVYEMPGTPTPRPSSVAELVSTLEESIAFAKSKISGWGDDGLREQWKMVRGGKTILEMPRVGVVRAVMLNHSYHHRGQLTVYLRLLDVPLPSVYGPTADEAMM